MPSPEGELDLRTVFDYDATRQFYADGLSLWLLRRTYGLNDVFRWVVQAQGGAAEMQSVATGELDLTTAAVIFPTWPDGIIGGDRLERTCLGAKTPHSAGRDPTERPA